MHARPASWGDSRAVSLVLKKCFYWLVVLLALLAAALPRPASADTAVAANITSDQRWTTAGSPYRVLGQLLVDGGATLTIEAGVTVYMGQAAGLSVRSGRILAQGASANPIHVLSAKAQSGDAPAPGDWGSWAFESGSSGSRLDWVLFEHGQGLRAIGSAPIFNFLDIRNHQGAAINIDLAASPSGVGNQATGNTINGVLVPAGDITGSVRWGLRGIPYVVAAGTVSVGTSPRLSSVLPATIQQGETVAVTATGQRLAGLASASTSNPAVSVQILPGATDTQAALSITAASNTPLGSVALRLLVDAGELLQSDALLVIPPEPKLASLTPTEVFSNRGGQTLQLAGQNFQATSVVELDGTPLTTTVQSAGSATAVLPNQSAAGNREIRVRTPNALVAGGSQLSNALTLKVVQPTAAVSPATVSMFQGNTQVIRLTLPFAAPVGGLSFAITSNAPLVVSAQDSVVVAAGATTAEFDIRGAGIGRTTVNVSRVGWTGGLIDATVIDPPRRIDLTPITSPLVGVVVGTDSGVTTVPAGPYVAAPVGLVVGAAASGRSPASGVVGTSLTLTVTGSGLDAVSRVDITPSTGITVSGPTGSGDGKQLTVQVTIAADAPKTFRRIALVTAAGGIAFLNPVDSQFLVTAPPPEIIAISPQLLVAGQAAVKLSVRGQNFRDITGVRFDPAAGMEVIGSPTVNGDGTLLEVYAQANSGAASGPHTLIVVGAAGESSNTASAANTVQVARTTGTQFEAIASPLVGVQVGAVAQTSVENGPYVAQPVGISFGLAANTMSPKAGTRGDRVTLTINGIGLTAVTGIRIEPATGLTLSTPVVSADGRQLTATLDIDFNTPDTLRQVVLTTASGLPVPFADPAESRFQVKLIVGLRLESMTSPLVGVQVGAEAVPTLDQGPYVAQPVGIVVGSAAQSISPTAGVVGTSVPIAVRGVGLAAVTSVAVLPSDGVTVTAPNITGDGQTIGVTLSIAVDAPKTVRRIALRTATGEITFTDPRAAQFLVTAPLPELQSITPQLVIAGAAATMLTVRGQNFRDILGVRFEPSDGMSVVGTPTANSYGTVLQVSVQAAAGATSGPRTLVVSAAAGDTSTTAAPANTIQVARAAGTLMDAIVSPLVGVQVGSATVLTDTQPVFAQPTGLVVGAAISSLNPGGSIKNVSGQWQFTGYGLSGVTGVRLTGSDGVMNAANNGVTVGAPVVSADGTSVTVPYTVAASAPNRTYRVDLLAGSNVLPTVTANWLLWEVVDLPRIDSSTPNVFQLGRSYSFVVRGLNLRRVTELVFEPAGGLQMPSVKPVYSTDAFGELLTVTLIVASDAAQGPRVLRLRYPADLTDATPTAANVINVVP